MKQIIPIVIIIILIFIIRGVILSIHSVINNQYTISGLEKQVTEQKKEHTFLQERLKYVKENAFVEEEAREKLGLVKQGEFIVLLPSPDKKRATPQYKIDTRPNWQKWWDVFNN